VLDPSSTSTSTADADNNIRTRWRRVLLYVTALCRTQATTIESLAALSNRTDVVHSALFSESRRRCRPNQMNSDGKGDETLPGQWTFAPQALLIF
jgi:hypothetical protein